MTGKTGFIVQVASDIWAQQSIVADFVVISMIFFCLWLSQNNYFLLSPMAFISLSVPILFKIMAYSNKPCHTQSVCKLIIKTQIARMITNQSLMPKKCPEDYAEKRLIIKHPPQFVLQLDHIFFFKLIFKFVLIMWRVKLCLEYLIVKKHI